MTKPDVDRIRRALDGAAASRVDRIDAFEQVESTNTFLQREPSPPSGHTSVAIADHQTAGRGRHARKWISSPGSSLCLSLAYTFQKTPETLPPFTLAIGVAIADAFTRLGIENIQLKWPNDLLVDGAKLGGILVESKLGKRDEITVVAGIGINIELPDEVVGAVQSGWAHRPVALGSISNNLPERDELAAILVQTVFDAMTLYDDRGLAPFEQAFMDFDWLRGRSIVVETPEGEVAGVGAGIEPDGALLLQRVGRIERIVSGSIRSVERRDVGKQAI